MSHLIASSKLLTASRHGGVYIGVGLAILILGDWWSHAPVLTAIALVSFGATDLTNERFRQSSAYFPVVLLHGLIYACLYGSMAGARIDASGALHSIGPSGWI